MDFFQPDLRFGAAYKGEPATLSELWDVTREGQSKIENFNALWRSLEDEVDQRNDRISKAGGPQLRNPLRDQTSTEERQAMMRQIGGGQTDMAWAQYYRLAQYEAELAELEKSKPDLAEAIGAKEPPSMAVARRMHEVEKRRMDVYDRRGMVAWQFPGSELITGPINIFRDPIGMAAIMGGSLQAQMSSPADIAAILAGNVATSPAKSLLKNAMRNAAANAGTQAFLEPQVQAQRAAVGLESGLRQATSNIAAAGGIGAALDVGFRAPVRAFNRARGVEGLGGAFSDAPEPVAPGSRPAEQPTQPFTIDPELAARAEAGDPAAMRAVYDALPDEIRQSDPALRGAMAEAEMDARSPVQLDGIDNGDSARVFAQTIMADLDPMEPRPRMPDPVPEARVALDAERGARAIADPDVARALDAVRPGLDQAMPGLSARIEALIEAGHPRVLEAVDDALAKAKGVEDAAKAQDAFVRAAMSLADEIGPDRLAALADIHSGLGNALDTARAIRQMPDLIDTSTPMTEAVRLARSLARLSDDAFGMVERGEADPLIAQQVSDHVADTTQHAGIIDGIRQAGISDPDQARRAIPDLMPRERDATLTGEYGIDDPAGPEAKAQLDLLRAEMAPEMAEHKARLEARKQQAEAAAVAEAQRAELVAQGEAVRAAVGDVMGIVPSDFQVKVFSGVADLPPNAAREVMAANGAAFRDNLLRFSQAGSDAERLAARQAMDAAMANRMVEAFAADDTIWIASYAMNPQGRMAHEVVHALVKSGRLTPDELRQLAMAARQLGVFGPEREALYRRTYEVREGVGQARLAEMLDEEAAAHLVEARQNGLDITPPETVPEMAAVPGILDRVQAFFAQVRDAIGRAMGQTRQDAPSTRQDASSAVSPVKDLLDAILSGEVARREAMAAVMREEDISALAVRSDGPMMAMGDLDMSPEARRARAEEMGFDTSRVYYKGYYPYESGGPVTANGKVVRVEPYVEKTGLAGFFTTDKELANKFSGVGWFDNNAVAPVYLRFTNPLVIDAEGNFAAAVQFESIAMRDNTMDKLDQYNSAFQNGFDAIIIKNTRDEGDIVKIPTMQQVRSVNAAFDPRQSDSPNLMFSLSDRETGQGMRRDMDALGFRSAALDAARSLKQAKGTPEQMMAQLKSAGVKDAEIEATGLRSIFDGKTSITRDEIISHLEENRVGLREVRYGDERPEYTQFVRAMEEKYGDGWWAQLDDSDSAKRMELAGSSTDPKWNEYSLDPSNPTYRETVLHLPVDALADRVAAQSSSIASNADQWIAYNAARDRGVMGDELARLRDAALGGQNNRLSADRAVPEHFSSGHFPEPNIIGHLMTSMVRHEGKPTYLIDQIQSDWGQAARDKGVITPEKQQRFAEANARAVEATRRMEDALAEHEAKGRELLTSIEPSTRASTDGGLFSASKDHSLPEDVRKAASNWLSQQYEIRNGPLASEAARLRAEASQMNQGVQGHPLVNTTDQWVNTTLRRALRQAAEADASYIAIPTGDTVLSYNPGDENGMRQFYGSLPQADQLAAERASGRALSPAYVASLEANAKGVEGIVPKNLRKLIERLDKDSPRPIKADQLETPSKGMAGSGFTLFPLSESLKQKARTEGQVMFAFAGERAKTADLDALARAKQMEMDGTDRTKIWTDTGWFRGVDGKWKWEIDDSGADFDLKGALGDGWKPHQKWPLDHLLTHKPLYSAYPDMPAKGISYRDFPEGYDDAGAATSRDGNAITLNSRYRDFNNEGVMRSFSMHEAQHLTQRAEDFARGGGARDFTPADLAAERARLQAIQDGKLNVNDWSSFDASPAVSDMPDKMVGHSLYRRLAGETEARAVEKRMDMSPAERRARPPWLDYDVPEDQQIVRFADGTAKPEGPMFAMRDTEPDPLADLARTWREAQDAVDAVRDGVDMQRDADGRLSVVTRNGRTYRVSRDEDGRVASLELSADVQAQAAEAWNALVDAVQARIPPEQYAALTELLGEVQSGDLVSLAARAQSLTEQGQPVAQQLASARAAVEAVIGPEATGQLIDAALAQMPENLRTALRSMADEAQPEARQPANDNQDLGPVSPVERDLYDIEQIGQIIELIGACR